MPIVVKAFANADGLSQLLVRLKLLSSLSHLNLFARGFSQAFDTCDFVLVGAGKDRADEKIKGVFKTFVGNPTCRQVLFAACHDNGYVRLLEKYQHSPVAEKVTLLNSFETGKEFAGLGFRSTKMQTVFRSGPLDSRKMSGNTPSQRALSAGARGGNGNNNAAGTGNTKKSEALPEQKNLGKVCVFVNAAGQRIDARLPRPRPEDFRRWNQKVKNAQNAGKKFCNSFYLHPDGCEREKCPFLHDALSEGEIAALRCDARQEFCRAKEQCRDPNCFFGHHCSCNKTASRTCRVPARLHGVEVGSVESVLGDLSGSLIRESPREVLLAMGRESRESEPEDCRDGVSLRSEL